MDFSNTKADRPPADHELEMTIFGPGVGECIVLHVGNGDWIVVDSCKAPTSDLPIAIEYLTSLGVDPGASIRTILATHWHDDHVQGIAEIVRQCPDAEFAISAALDGQQFVQLVLEVDAQNKLVKHSSSASELAEVLEILHDRRSSRFVVGPDRYAQDGTLLFRGGHGNTAEVWALSPSAATVTNSLARLSEILLTAGDTKRFKRFSPNDLSVAIHVQAGLHSLLLGADLENTVSGEFGWKAVMSSTVRPNRRSDAFKVAHHGSANAHHDNIWTSLLIGDPVAVVTPYLKLTNPIPTDRDIQRIKNRTSNAYCTTWPFSSRPPRRHGVDSILRGATRVRRALNPRSGFIRLRLDLNSANAKPSVEMFGSARQI